MRKSLLLTGGSYSGRRLYVPKKGIRPATNRVREAIFQILQTLFEKGIKGLEVLDLFAGSGSLGIEALSRGAASCTFVENDPDAVKSIKKNLKLLNLKGEVVLSDVHGYLRAKKRLQFDLIFMDPPYQYKSISDTVSLLIKAMNDAFSPLLIYERSYDKKLPDFGEKTSLLKKKKYGQTQILYYRIGI